MIAGLLGSQDAERVLLFMAARGSGYGREIAAFWGGTVSAIQKILDRLERGGVLISRKVGTARIYEFNPRWPMRAELQALLEKTITFLPKAQQQALLENRRRPRPRRRGKPLAIADDC